MHMQCLHKPIAATNQQRRDVLAPCSITVALIGLSSFVWLLHQWLQLLCDTLKVAATTAPAAGCTSKHEQTAMQCQQTLLIDHQC